MEKEWKRLENRSSLFLSLPSVFRKMALFKKELDQPQPQMKENENTWNHGLTTDRPW